MGKVGERVIRPPTGNISSGKIFRPAKAFLYKLWLKTMFAMVSIWSLTMLGFICLANLIAYSEPVKYVSAAEIIGSWAGPVGLWTFVLNLPWLAPALVIAPAYYKSMEYSVKAESGETLPEIYSKKGVLTITRKHLPFRTITNISSRTGPFDRLLGIGSVHVETAGYSGQKQTGPEEKLEGIVFYEEVRDFILSELRRFKVPYATGTEAVPSESGRAPGDQTGPEMLKTLQEIRELLKTRTGEDT